jgi:hypothetical protein
LRREVFEFVWYDASSLTIEGRGWNDTEEFYNRLPAESRDSVPEAVWGLSTHTAGIVVRFVTDSPRIDVRWTLLSPQLAMNHMPSTGVSGVDLYLRYDGKWRWLAIGIPTAEDNEAELVSDLPPDIREYVLYLPLYNGIKSLEIGLADGATMKTPPPRKLGAQPVVFYGSSITQGGCVSRPGMAYPSIIGRNLDVPIINLGFSGSGRCEPEVADLLAELDPSLYVIDCLPNMDAVDVDERLRYLLSKLKTKRPGTPVVLVENLIYQNEFIRDAKNAKNPILAKIFRDVAPSWDGRLHYVKCGNLVGADGEATVDAVHPTDLGHQRMSLILTKAANKALLRE